MQPDCQDIESLQGSSLIDHCFMAGEGECWRRFKYGALIGSTVGGCIGLLFGTFAVLRYHITPIHLCTLGMVMEVPDSFPS
jgi:reactive oxygen species modulator 1